MPNKYIVRHGQWSDGPGTGYAVFERRVFAWSALDAKAQVELFFQESRCFGGVLYVGPVVEGCGCLNQCTCGVGCR
jgi:hypothetical protein